MRGHDRLFGGVQCLSIGLPTTRDLALYMR